MYCRYRNDILRGQPIADRFIDDHRPLKRLGLELIPTRPGTG